MLTGCANDLDELSGKKLTLISEECRARAAVHVPPTGAVWEKTDRGWQTSFDREFHECIKARGMVPAAP